MKFIVMSALVATSAAWRPDRNSDEKLTGGRWPEWILPGSVPIMPIPSAPILLQTNAETSSEAHIRHKLQKKLRKYLKKERQFVQEQENTLIMLQDDGEEDTVESARLKAAQMQAQLDQAVAEADAKREEQRKAFET